MASHDEFTRTLDALESRRRQAERDVDESLRRARALLDEFASQAESAHRLLERMRDRLSAESVGPESGRRVGQVGTKEDLACLGRSVDGDAEGGRRGSFGTAVAALVDWLLGGTLRRWDEDLRAQWQRLETIEGDVRGLGETLRACEQRLRAGGETWARASRDSSRDRVDSFTALTATMLSAVEALAANIGVHEKLIALTDARGAETVRRSVDDRDGRVERELDEFSRRQEALLAELVGRRRHLERLLGDLRDGPDVRPG